MSTIIDSPQDVPRAPITAADMERWQALADGPTTVCRVNSGEMNVHFEGLICTICKATTPSHVEPVDRQADRFEAFDREHQLKCALPAARDAVPRLIAAYQSCLASLGKVLVSETDKITAIADRDDDLRRVSRERDEARERVRLLAGLLREWLNSQLKDFTGAWALRQPDWEDRAREALAP